MASEYGWAQRDILYNTYPDEFFLLQRQIRMRKTDEWLMDIAIVANPHKEQEDAKEFVESLLSQRRFYRGEPEVSAELDVAAFESFRGDLSKNSRFIKAK